PGRCRPSSSGRGSAEPSSSQRPAASPPSQTPGCGTRCGRCRPNSGPPSPITTSPTCPTARSESSWAPARPRRGAAPPTATPPSALAGQVSPRVLRAPARLDAAARQLDEYFTRTRQSFGLSLDLRLAHGFRRTVLEHLTQIGYGTTASYGAVAAAAGSPAAVR